MPGLAGRTAIVTGGSRGIGRAVCEALGTRGADVVVNYATRSDAADEVVAAVQAAGSRAIAVQGVLDGPGPVRALFDAARDAFGRVDILVNNAATARLGPIGTVDEAEFDATFAVNVKAAFFAVREAAEHLSDGGRIVSISAAQTRVGYANTTLYAATKGAVEQLSLAAARELGARGIRVNVVSPGATDTDLYNGLASPQAQEVARARSPMGRIGTPAEVAEVVAFLCSDESSWVSGQNIVVSGDALW